LHDLVKRFALPGYAGNKSSPAPPRSETAFVFVLIGCVNIAGLRRVTAG